MPQLTAILDEVFGSQPMTHWYEVFNGVHVTFGAVRGPQEVINDPQLRLNDIVVPLDGAGGKLTSTISSPIQVHGVTKVPARRAPRWENTTRRFSSSSALARAKSTACTRAATVPAKKERAGGRGTDTMAMRWLRKWVLHRVATARMPTKWGMFNAAGFERQAMSGVQRVDTAMAMLMGDLSGEAPLLRIHSQCFTGEGARLPALRL